MAIEVSQLSPASFLAKETPSVLTCNSTVSGSDRQPVGIPHICAVMHVGGAWPKPLAVDSIMAEERL